MDEIVSLINKYGFPIVAAFGLGYFVYYVWQWVTTEIKPVTSDANKVLIELIDRIRMLDNDLIRLNQKVNVILSLRNEQRTELKKSIQDFDGDGDIDDEQKPRTRPSPFNKQ
jgi:hypothetical protein